MQNMEEEHSQEQSQQSQTMLNPGVLFNASTAGCSVILKGIRNNQPIDELLDEVVTAIRSVEMRVSFTEQQSAGASIVMVAKHLVTHAHNKVLLIRLYELGLEMLGSFDKIDNMRWPLVVPLYSTYLEGIPPDSPGAKKYLQFLLKMFDVMKVSIRITDEYFSFRYANSPGKAISRMREILNNTTRDLEVRKLALEVMGRVIRQCPLKKAPVVGLMVSGTLSCLLRVASDAAVNAELLKNTLILFRETVLLVFGNEAKQFDITKIDMNELPAELKSIVEQQSTTWRSEAAGVMTDYITKIQSIHMQHRSFDVKWELCDMILSIHKECSDLFVSSLDINLLEMYMHLRYDSMNEFREVASACLLAINDQRNMKSYLYDRLQVIYTKLPLQTRTEGPKNGLRALAAIIEALDDSITVMCTSGSETIELVLKAVADAIIVNKKGLLVHSYGESFSVKMEMERYFLDHRVEHKDVMELCRTLARLGRLEIVAVINQLMSGNESPRRRVSYHILLAYILDALCPSHGPDSPIAIMLAEYMIAEMNESTPVTIRYDHMPAVNLAEVDWDTCIESLSCTNVALCMKFVNDTAHRSNILIRSLCKLLYQTTSPTWIVSESAEFALSQLAKNQPSLTRCDVHHLVRTYSSHVLNAASMACASSTEYHMVPGLLIAYMRKTKIGDQFDEHRVIVEKLLYALDRNEQKHTVAILNALNKFTDVLDDAYPNLAPVPPDEEDEEQKCTATPQHVLTEKILNRTKHMLTTPHLGVRLTTLEILSNGMRLLANFDDMLLPMIHQHWYAIMAIVRGRDPISVLAALEVVTEMTEYSRTFVHGKILKELWPALEGYLITTTNAIRGREPEHSAPYQLIVKTVKLVPEWVSLTEFTEEEYRSTVFKFLEVVEKRVCFGASATKQKKNLEKYFAALRKD